MIKAKKTLGQNFLKSKNILAVIIGISNITTDDVVLEIGPGKGILTEELLKFSGKVMSVEKDDRLIPILREKFQKEIKEGKLGLIHGDILDMDMSKRHFDTLDNKKYKVVANIPYYITGQILRMFLETENQPESITLLVQKEVAERIVAKDDKESLLSLSVKIFGNPKYVKTVSRKNFSPEPNVDSAVLHIGDISKNRLDGIKEELFFKIIHTGFAHKRKQLLPNLTTLYSREKLTEIFKELGLNLTSRAEDIPLERWVELCKILQEIQT